MLNVKTSVKGKVLTIEVDLAKEFGLSASGKSVIIASTQGNQKVGDVVVGLNVYRKPT